MTRIVTASREHLSEIADLARANRLDSLNEETAAECGFLVSGYDLADYKDFLEQAGHFYVMVDGNIVLGFVLGFASRNITANEWVGTQLRTRLGRDFVLIKQVCIAADQTSRGFATQLYDHLIREAPDRPIVGAIVADPPNRRSTQFHKKLGFRKIWTVTPPDGLVRDVWFRE